MDDIMDKYSKKVKSPRDLIKGNYYVFKYNPPLGGDDRDLRPGDDPNVNINKREGMLSNIEYDMNTVFYIFKNVTYLDEPERPMKETGRYVNMMATENGEHTLEIYDIPRAAFEGAGVKRRTRRNRKSKRRKTKRNRKSKRRRRYM